MTPDDRPATPDKPISDQEGLEMMNRCRTEILQLRAQLAACRPKADAYDNLTIVLGLLPRKSQGMGPDIIWQLEKRIEELRNIVEKKP